MQVSQSRVSEKDMVVGIAVLPATTCTSRQKRHYYVERREPNCPPFSSCSLRNISACANLKVGGGKQGLALDCLLTDQSDFTEAFCLNSIHGLWLLQRKSIYV